MWAMIFAEIDNPNWQSVATIGLGLLFGSGGIVFFLMKMWKESKKEAAKIAADEKTYTDKQEKDRQKETADLRNQRFLDLKDRIDELKGLLVESKLETQKMQDLLTERTIELAEARAAIAQTREQNGQE